MNGDQIPRTLSVVEMTGLFVKFLILSPLESLRSCTLVLISPGVKLRVQITLSRPFTKNKICQYFFFGISSTNMQDITVNSTNNRVMSRSRLNDNFDLRVFLCEVTEILLDEFTTEIRFLVKI